MAPPTAVINTTTDILQQSLAEMAGFYHRAYFMENENHNVNTLIRASFNLMLLGAHPISTISRIIPCNWKDRLGDWRAYPSYLIFFDSEVARLGILQAVQTYFVDGGLWHSIGSQMQPVVHLAFGIESQVDSIVSQGLAHLASSYLSAKSISQTNSENVTDENAISLETLVFDLAAFDRRFHGLMEDASTFDSAFRRVLRTQGVLLREYVQLAPQLSIQELTHLTAQLMQTSDQNDRPDSYLAGPQLLEAVLAVHILQIALPGLPTTPMLRNVLLTALITFLVRGCPARHHALPPVRGMCSRQMVLQTGDPSTGLAYAALVRASKLLPSEADLFAALAHQRVQHVREGCA
ncbi:hypothetical protein BCR43DRAFT_512617 [Syncephalastrum racemosum]|uniref:Uncharacterized protein n=1 Tax=Syncephalastrum racemosum TaxID=13706 RepID=A0A1X2HR84_SYNRA|nr:hypothetical protein BCR43DRAFT_512617 [Syncephalastrum racemosum]